MRVFFLFFLIFLSCERTLLTPPKQEKIKRKVIYKYKEKKFEEPEIKILLKEGRGPYYLSATSKYRIIAGNKKYTSFPGDFLKFEFVSFDKLMIYYKGKSFLFETPILLETNDGYLLFENKRYRGKILFESGEKVINILKLEDYLLSVVPNEIGPANPSLVESAKAQAICSRSYALRKYIERNNSPFHLYSDIRDQVYFGKDFENPWATAAVNSTRGIVCVYKDEIALTLYHSTCGGITANFKDAFPTIDEVFYLRNVRCNLNGKDLCKSSPYYVWERKYKKEDFINLLKNNFLKIYGIEAPNDILQKMEIINKSKEGRIYEIKVCFSQSYIILKSNEIRKIFGDPVKGPLPSSWFDLIFIGDEVIIKGRGFGHGIGLCQYGARELSKMGLNYEEILRFYFPGTRVKKIYN
jgi:stage II sporulation protein D